jgi:hypothetical protein
MLLVEETSLRTHTTASMRRTYRIDGVGASARRPRRRERRTLRRRSSGPRPRLRLRDTARRARRLGGRAAAGLPMDTQTRVEKARTGRERGAGARARAYLFPRINSTRRHHLPARCGAENLFFAVCTCRRFERLTFFSTQTRRRAYSVSTSFVRCYGAARGVLKDGSGRGLPTRPFVR